MISKNDTNLEPKTEEKVKLEIEDSDVCAIYCPLAFTVDPKKSQEFKNLKSSSESNIKNKEVLEKLHVHINNLNEEGPVLKKNMKFNNKKN